MIPFRDKRTGIFYRYAIDLDSSIPARVKIWDPREHRAWVICWCLMTYLLPREKELKEEFNLIPHP